MLAEQKLQNYKDLQEKILLIEQDLTIQMYTNVLTSKDLQMVEVEVLDPDLQALMKIFLIELVEEEQVING